MSAQQAASNTSVERRGVVARLLIRRPPWNILDIATIRELSAQADALAKDSEIRLLEIAGAGEKAFSAGADIQDHFPERAPEMLGEFHALIRRLMDSRVPTLAVVRGHCLGGGLELALACDFIFASAEEALGWGLVNAVASPQELESQVEKFSAKLLGHSPRVVELARRAIRAAGQPAFESALREAERIYLQELLRTDDALEGLRAFVEKRQPQWKGK